MDEYRELGDFSRYTRKWLTCILAAASVSLAGCAPMCPCPGDSPAEKSAEHILKSSLPRAQEEKYKSVQRRIGTNADLLYHDAVVEPDAFETPYSFYLLGVEKPRDKSSLRPYCQPTEAQCATPKFDPGRFEGSEDDDQSEIAKTRNDIDKNLFQDVRPLVLTHILKARKTTAVAGGGSQDGCFIFNVYGHDSETSWCKKSFKGDVEKEDWKRQGWMGLDQLAADIRERVVAERATHIILLTTGWNTRQYESYQDFLAWMNRITNDFQKNKVAFRPIFVGTAWESEWPWWEHIPFVSEFTKGNDADEIGFTWENYLLNDLAKPIAKSSGAQLVVIGHSFGSRIALGAHYGRHILARQGPFVDAPLTIIGMQAAFPVARFVTSEGKEHQYIDKNRGTATVVITSSDYDEATGKMCIGTAYVGAGCGLTKLRQEITYEESVAVLTAGDSGKPASPPDARRVSVYDASLFVNCQLKGTRSGAHSDVYDEAMGHFLGEIIRGSVGAR